jgi:hypothetical protein
VWQAKQCENRTCAILFALTVLLGLQCIGEPEGDGVGFDARPVCWGAVGVDVGTYEVMVAETGESLGRSAAGRFLALCGVCLL